MLVCALDTRISVLNFRFYRISKYYHLFLHLPYHTTRRSLEMICLNFLPL